MRLANSRLSKSFGIAVLSCLLSFALIGPAASANAKRQAPPSDAASYQSWLSNQVRHQLVMLPWYSLFDNLEYRIDGNNVTLLGQVVRPNLKSDAESAVKHIEGVGTISNQIEVLPLSPMDNQIRRAEFRAIYGTPGFDVYAIQTVQPIHIIVNNGHVTLEGMVRNQTDKNLAGMAANRVPNVFSVTNNLRVEQG
jgi:hyperosmotically inducible periplasmic protein